jgi:hypothetical protein
MKTINLKPTSGHFVNVNRYKVKDTNFIVHAINWHHALSVYKDNLNKEISRKDLIPLD